MIKCIICWLFGHVWGEARGGLSYPAFLRKMKKCKRCGTNEF